MKSIFTYLLVIMTLFSCEEDKQEVGAVARVNDKYLYPEDMNLSFAEGLSKEDSLLYRNNYIKIWATKELLLEKARINIEDTDGEIATLVKNYEKELLIDRYKKAVLQQELDTVITEQDIDQYYEANKNVYKLNEDLIQLKYIHFSNELSDRKDLIKLFKSDKAEDLEVLIGRELEFFSFTFNDSIWLSSIEVEKKLTFLREEGDLKKNQYIQKEDSLGVYLLAVRDILHRNQVAPKSYVIPTIKQMILHKRKLELMNNIEKTIMIDAIKKKQFEQY
jgi:hypothetical protein